MSGCVGFYFLTCLFENCDWERGFQQVNSYIEKHTYLTIEIISKKIPVSLINNQSITSRKHTYIILTPSNPTFI